LFKRDGLTDEAFAKYLVDDRLARLQVVAGGVLEGGAVYLEEHRH
jgi:hypothetical protein